MTYGKLNEEITKSDSSQRIRPRHSWPLKMTREDEEVRGSLAHEHRKWMSLPLTRHAEVRGQLVSFQELTAKHEKVKTSIENEPQIR